MDEIRTMDQAVKAMANREGKYLTFVLAGEEYGIGILKVKEIIGIMAITTVPQTPAYMKGVINLRGKVIPIVDLRVKFGMEAIDYTEKTCIIVVEIANSGQKVMIGVGNRAVMEGENLVLSVGLSHPVKVPAPQGIVFSVDKNIITVVGPDRGLVGQTAANIRKVRPPEPYKGKGIRYFGEQIKLKEGKRAATATASA